MIRHFRKQHGKWQPFECKLCPEKFARPTALRAHIAWRHDKMLAYKPRARKEVKRSSFNTTIKVSILIGNIRQGEREQFEGGRQNLKSTQNKPFPAFYLYKI
jgi:hypothetical protein